MKTFHEAKKKNTALERQARAKRRLFEEGQAAALAGKSAEECPYRSDAKIAEWQRGFRAGEDIALTCRAKKIKRTPIEIEHARRQLDGIRQLLRSAPDPGSISL